ncbi:MAG TPA: CopG family transcriptional regulator [Vicinamibacteria bacterium]|nr:CopG family transcriptional regulator [Vicinamibacteria bacterium]
MKTAISIPDDVFKKADRLARRLGMSRSQLYSLAVEEYVTRMRPESITDAMNRVVERLDEPCDDFVAAAAKNVLSKSEW